MKGIHMKNTVACYSTCSIYVCSSTARPHCHTVTLSHWCHRARTTDRPCTFITLTTLLITYTKLNSTQCVTIDLNMSTGHGDRKTHCETAKGRMHV